VIKILLDQFEIDCIGLGFRELNKRIRDAIKRGFKKIKLVNVNGQRYICAGVKDRIEVEIHGSPGNNLGIFMDGPRIVVYGNAGDGVGNTMNNGLMTIHGSVGDVVGYSMRGGRIYIKGDAGYRLGIHMKEFGAKRPIIVVGGSVGDFLGEYMAGGIIIALGLDREDAVKGRFVASGIHGGRIYLRDGLKRRSLGFGAALTELDEEDYKILERILEDYCLRMNYSRKSLLSESFVKIIPKSKRPYKTLYHQTALKV